MAEEFAHVVTDLDSGQAFDLYRELHAGGVDVQAQGDRFFAEVKAWRLAGVILLDRRLAGVVHERTAERVRQDGFDHFTVHLLVEGAVEIDSGAGYAGLAPGQVALLDMTRPMRNRVSEGRLITASVSREVVQMALGSAVNLHGRIIGQGQALLLADYMKSLVRRVAEIGEADLPAVSRALIDLLTVAVGGIDLDRGADLRRLEFARRESVRRFIETHLDREITAEMISDATGVSRATLYRILQGDGGVVRMVQSRRLVRLRARLNHPTDDRSLADLAEACGFKSESHMGQLFRDAFAITPGEYRRQLRSAGTASEKMTIARERWAAWMSEIR